MNYNEALNYIHNISWEFCKPGLERTRALCLGLGNPEKSLKFIHVAGTNGKGSFCSMLSSILIEQGYKVGTYTSPYIKCFNERMMINNTPISDEELVEITEKVREVAEKMEEKPTEFELVTAIALKYFSKNKCDYVVLECGLGGRLDSTNVVENVLLSVITGISLDHTSILGNTIKEIAYEKAGIIKNATPCLFCGENEDAREVILKVASEKHSPVTIVDHTSLQVVEKSLNGTTFDFDGYQDVKIKLLGMYQPINASNVLKAVELLKAQGISISKASIYKGLENASWSARFERISTTPQVIFDGAHNPEGVLSATQSIKEYFGKEKVYVLTGVMADKDYRFIAKAISDIAERVYCITPSNPRALNAKKFAEVFRENCVIAQSFESISDAVKQAKNEAQKAGKTLLCLGSLYMYSEIIDLM